MFLVLINVTQISSKSVETYSDNQSENLFERQESITISFVYRNENVILDLELSKLLIPNDHFISIQNKEGTHVKKFPEISHNFCHYDVSFQNVSFVNLEALFYLIYFVIKGKNSR